MAAATAALSLEDLGALPASPFALEDLGTAVLPLLFVDLEPTGGDHLTEERLDDLAAFLGSIRAVTVAWVGNGIGPARGQLASHFDIVLASPDAAGEALVPTDDPSGTVDLLGAAVQANPQSAVALVELLRLGVYHSVPQGLVAESLTYSMLQSGPEFADWLAARGPADLPDDPDMPVLVARAGTSLDITLNRPHRANAFTAAIRDHLVEAFRVAAVDPMIEGVVLRGAGASFSSGGDLAEFGSAPDPATGYATRLLRSPAWWVHHLARDVRVHLHGACVGAGIEVPAFAGTVIAASDTRIRLPEVAMGLVPGAGGTVSLPRRIGPHRTAYLALSGAELDAPTALAWGLVDRLE